MSFELHITCSKDIDKLHIDFSDGTSVVTHSDKTPTKKTPTKKTPTKKTPTKKTPKHNVQNGVNGANGDNSSKSPKKQRSRKEEFLDTEEDYSPVSQEVVQKPEILEPERDIKVASELQNLDI